MGALAAAEVVDSGEKRDTFGRRVTPAARRAELMAEYRRSGMTIAAFARREKISYSTLAGWLLRARRDEPKAPIAFAQLPFSVAAETPARHRFEVRLPDGTVIGGATAADVATLARAIRS